jgi:RNA polymerase sigma-70 factor (ECF subfamily)
MDIVQETFVSAFGHIDKLEVRGTASILQWLSRIAENQMHDTYRRHYGLKRDKSREIGLATGVPGDEERELAVPALTDEMTPDHRAEKREMEQIVDEAVAELPEDYREVIILRTYYGGSWDFVTTQMGRPNVDATRQLFRRARIRLGRLVRQRLASGGDPEPAPD